MKDIYKLYINGNLVDLTEEPNFAFTYQLEDLSNPTVVKNNFSKTIKINGTDNNNQIFGEIYKLDREQIYKFNKGDGAYFDASKRTPFALYKDAELIEEGYIQLTDIIVKNMQITYNITLYGGLGDFFYNLMYDDSGEKKTLADLYFKVKEKRNNGTYKQLPKDTELNFKINKEFVNRCWDALYEDDENRIEDIITFAPSYNGLYDNFSNNAICINTNNSEVFNNDNTIIDNGVTYTTYEGYKLAKVEREFTEWETKDLRSYMQRPCIRFKKLFEALCDGENNGGYKVNLDNTFFNTYNTYYEKAYMALPLLPTIAEGNSNENLPQTFNLYVDSNYYANTAHIGQYNSTLRLTTSYRFAFNGEELEANSANDFLIDMTNIPITSTFDVKLDFDLSYIANYLDNTMNNDNLYLGFMVGKWRQKYFSNEWHWVTRYHYKSIIVQAYMYDAENPSAPMYFSNVLNFTSPYQFNGETYVSTPDKWVNYTTTNKDLYTYTNVFGSFKRQGQTNNYKWVSNDGYSKFFLDIKDIPRKNGMAIGLTMQLVYDQYNGDRTTRFLNNIQFYQTYGDTVGASAFPLNNTIDGYATLPLYSSSVLVWKKNTPTVRSNSNIEKNTLLKTEFSPCDVLLDYCKLFGLYFTKDLHSKTINILTKNTFFNGNIINLNNKIDHLQEMKIKPYLFETKYYLMNYDNNDSYFAKKYKNEYNLIYGQQRIDTNYNFNKDTKEIYDGTIFQNAITVSDTSPYYKTFYNKNGVVAPSWLLENPTITLYNGIGSNNEKTYDKTYSYNDYLNLNLTTDWNVKSGYDVLPKTCFYNLDNNSKSLNDITSTLLFFDGFLTCKDINGNNINYWLSDDVYSMAFLNDQEMCYLYTESEYDITANRIAYKLSALPSFSRYYTFGNNIIDSMDFGKPKEIYIPEINYNESATLYNKFWKNYLSDRYSVNTKKVSCYVNWGEIVVNQASLRNFYFFDNCVWVINKIENYTPNNLKPTKVEFIKVNETENYLRGQQQFEFYPISLNESEATVDFNTTKYTVELKSSTNWTATTKYTTMSSTNPRTGESGTYTIELLADANTQYSYIWQNEYYFTDDYGNKVTFKLQQVPSPLNAKYLSGYVYSEKTQQPLSNCYVVFKSNWYGNEEEVTQLWAKTNSDGFYDIYLGKDIQDEFGFIWVYIYEDINEENELLNTIIEYDSLQNGEERNFAID